MLEYVPFAILLLFGVAGAYLGFVVWKDYRRRRMELEQGSGIKVDQPRSD
jgi:hypothetical protein